MRFLLLLPTGANQRGAPRIGSISLKAECHPPTVSAEFCPPVTQHFDPFGSLRVGRPRHLLRARAWRAHRCRARSRSRRARSGAPRSRATPPSFWRCSARATPCRPASSACDVTNEYGEWRGAEYYPWRFVAEPYRVTAIEIENASEAHSFAWSVAMSTAPAIARGSRTRRRR